MLIILDRDGVINHDSDFYIKSVDEWQPIEGSIEAIAALKQAGHSVAVATNQSGLARGYYTLGTLNAMHAKMQQLLQPFNTQVDYIAYCPHGPDDVCSCRKPLTGMLEAIAQQFNSPKAEIMMIGDSISDYQAASAFGIEYLQVLTGKGERTVASGKLPSHIKIYSDLRVAVQALLS
ncbi:MAG: D-glycero-beta-D-manno-heptose 1,7-bisphosphate 7-phosphatase [Thiofilum sp.]|uniref:D-glycero-beta-D-manno-heptose 1,7-bisphosphate 7-phosphatase n=1 Tax=Thiofilum sp. TaxID=2212733 RepID=UPI0025F6E549|nr:D-glycero-beta-D-manno-heptose 1,7-bisphosphate 7-phosphatase [Thiofilum sp.]MBK8452692.1 D-glycero-beta-D-manno-heptose 1,7-bisphosphate 7-phosphatase [Thiofilum sp.]